MKLEELKKTPCPACGKKKLGIEMRLVAKPLGSFSVSGVTPKVVAYEWPYLVCRACGVNAPAKERS